MTWFKHVVSMTKSRLSFLRMMKPVARMRGGYRLICAGFDTNIVAEGWRRMREAARRDRQG